VACLYPVGLGRVAGVAEHARVVANLAAALATLQ
jgi:hypothetical protein